MDAAELARQKAAKLHAEAVSNGFTPFDPYAFALAEAKQMGLCLPGLSLANQLYLSVKSQGYGRNGTHALQLALAKMAGIDWQKRG